MLTYPVHKTGSTGTGRTSIAGMTPATRLEVEFVVEAVGATPTVTFQVEGLLPGGNVATATDWVVLALVAPDATTASSSAPITVSATGSTRRYLDGLDKRFFDAFAVNVTANTNVTFRSSFNRADRP